ncbi:MAG: hypothetical protein GY765_07895, partial [bacterium]|nr:hypothetical protein [bacterium]
MINIPEAAQQILDIAGKKNCQAQVTIVDREAREISLRKGEIERLLTSIALSTGIRLFKDNKVTTISFSGNNFENMEEKIGS